VVEQWLDQRTVLFDNAGAVMLADYEFNQLAVILPASTPEAGGGIGLDREGARSATIHGSDFVLKIDASKSNTLFVVQPDRMTKQYHLMPGEAKRIREQAMRAPFQQEEYRYVDAIQSIVSR
jgi:hypothetical protein